MARDYCFTDFVTPELEYDKELFSKIKYICYGIETCPTTNRLHKQGFVIFNSTCRVPEAKRRIGGPNSIHLESKRGTRDQARDYCFKSGGDVFEWGEYDPMTQEKLFGKNKTWLLNNGYEGFFCRFHRAIEAKQDKGPKWRDVKVYWVWGEPGTGKTRFVMNKDDVFKFDSPYQWFDGYGGESILLIDDYETGEISGRQLKNLLDGYTYKLNIKGGHTYALWTEVYITSNYDISELPEWKVKGLQRRITEVFQM